MKPKLFFSLGLILLINLSYGQIENQWLIWNSSGKDGTLPGPNNFVSPISTQFTLMGIAPPDRVNIPNAKNDIFVIYTDGQHFNSRANPTFFYNLADFNATPMVTDHIFQKSTAAGPAGVQYLYLTNRYEGDDPPAKVMAMPGTQGHATTTYPISTTSSPMLSADHDVVNNKDITVIINYDLLRPYHTIEYLRDSTYTLKFDGIQTAPNQPISYNNDVLDLQPVFGANITGPLAYIYNGTTSPPPNTEVISLHPGLDHFGYVNFRKTNIAFPPKSNGDPQYYAVFTVQKNNQNVQQIGEPIRASHDPNYLEVKSICQQTDGSYLVTYHLQFENTSPVQATSLKADVTFPPIFDLSCLKAFNWHAAGTGCGGSVTPSGTTRTFQFNANGGIFHHPTNKDQGIGFFEFKVKVKAGSHLDDISVSLKLGTPLMWFDQQSFPIEDFRDLVQCKEKEGSHPESQQNADSLSNTEKNLKPDGKTVSSSPDHRDDGEGYVITKPLPKAGSYECARPISTGTCNCNKPFCWICVFVAVAVLGLAVAFFALRRKKKAS